MVDTLEAEADEIKALNSVLKDLKIKANVESCVIKGPLRRFRVRMADGVRMKKLDTYASEIAMAMKASADPLIMPNRVDDILDGTVRLDIMAGSHPMVEFDALARSIDFSNPKVLEEYNIPLLLGARDIDQPLIVDLQKLPHMLVAGVTGAGKSVMLRSGIRSCEIHSESQGIRIALVDPKGGVEFGVYEGSPALRYSVASDIDGALQILEYLHSTMVDRFEALSKHGCLDILEYRSLGRKMPFIVLFIDELADLMRDKKSGFAERLCSLAEKSRAIGIHIVAATQHPSSEVITGTLKAQFPARIACRVSSLVHSRVVLDDGGADKLLGKGDALLMDGSQGLQRFQGAFVDLSKRKKSRKSPVSRVKKTRKKRAKTKSKQAGTGSVVKLLTQLLDHMAAKKGKKKRKKVSSRS
jgi:S-DNA-T family DNA segregation ATPase FtsK/SpoIIIE